MICIISANLKKFFILSLFSPLLFAAVFTVSPSALADESELREGPCNKILEICKDLVKNSSKKLSLYRDCMQPLLNNEKVDNIKVDSAVLKACQEKKAEIKQKK